MKSTTKFLVLVSLLTCPNQVQHVQAAEPAWAKFEIGSQVAVKTTTGRVVRGAVDKRTSDQHLWIVAEVEGMAVGSRLSRESVSSIQSSIAVTLPSNATPSESELQNQQHQANRADHGSDRARSLLVFAQLDNWDYDQEADGLSLYLIPRDAHGNLVPVVGSVSVSLTTYHGDARSPLGAIKTEETWTVPVTAKDYSDKDGYVRLPFRKLHPETDATLQPVADLHVRLSVPGQGVLEASMEDVVVRPYAATQELRTLRSRTARF